MAALLSGVSFSSARSAAARWHSHSSLSSLLTNHTSGDPTQAAASPRPRRYFASSPKETDDVEVAMNGAEVRTESEADEYYAAASNLYQRGSEPVGSLFAGALGSVGTSSAELDTLAVASEVWRNSSALQQRAGSSSAVEDAQSAEDLNSDVGSLEWDGSATEELLDEGWESISELSRQSIRPSTSSVSSGRRHFSHRTSSRLHQNSGLLQQQRYAHAQASPIPDATQRPFVRRGHSPASDTDLSFPRHASPTPYDIFHLPRTCTPAEIKARWYELVRQLHPDRLASMRPEGSSAEARERASKRAHEDFKAVVSAYELLKSPRKRATFDSSGFGWGKEGSVARDGHDDDMYRWTEHLRRHKAARDPRDWRTHDRYGWQRAAGSSSAYSSFYGFTPHPAPHPNKPRYASNHSFFLGVFLVTWILGYAQFERLSAQSRRAVERADKSHLDAHKSLIGARTYARSDEGRMWMDAVRKRARESERGGDVLGNGNFAGGSSALMIEGPESGSYGIGHGGPSGKEAAEARWARASEVQNRKMGYMTTHSADG